MGGRLSGGGRFDRQASTRKARVLGEHRRGGRRRWTPTLVVEPELEVSSPRSSVDRDLGNVRPLNARRSRPLCERPGYVARPPKAVAVVGEALTWRRAARRRRRACLRPLGGAASGVDDAAYRLGAEKGCSAPLDHLVPRIRSIGGGNGRARHRVDGHRHPVLGWGHGETGWIRPRTPISSLSPAPSSCRTLSPGTLRALSGHVVGLGALDILRSRASPNPGSFAARRPCRR
jgi:hypothetical protein